MSREELRALFTELADGVAAPQLAAAAAARAARVRRRRRLVTGAALATVVAVSVAAVAWGPVGRTTVIPIDGDNTTAPSRPVGTARVDHLPATIALDPDATPYWPRSLEPPANAPVLSDHALSHAVLLYSPDRAGPGDTVAPIYAYGEGAINGGSGNGTFAWVRVEVDLIDTRDDGGNRAVPLDQNSLAPMGTTAAFAQPDSVVVVDLHIGAVERFPLPGLNEDVSWLPDGRHLLVSSATQTWLVDTRTGNAVPASARGALVTPLVGAARGLTTLTMDGADAPVLRVYDDGGLTELSHRAIDPAAGQYRMSYLSPRGWRYGNGVAQAASGQVGSGPGDFVVVIDDRTEGISHLLDLGGGRNKGCCAVLGWSNSDVVLVHTDQEGLLAWHLSTGAVTRLIPRAGGALSVAPTGCDWTVTIDSTSSSCVP